MALDLFHRYLAPRTENDRSLRLHSIPPVLSRDHSGCSIHREIARLLVIRDFQEAPNGGVVDFTPMLQLRHPDRALVVVAVVFPR